MLKKRVVLYFLIMGFPIGLGAGAPSWFKLPQLAPAVSTSVESLVPIEESHAGESVHCDAQTNLPDFGAIHPLVVGAFTLLFCSGVLLAADPIQKT
jgi:hypothetical protein